MYEELKEGQPVWLEWSAEEYGAKSKGWIRKSRGVGDLVFLMV